MGGPEATGKGFGRAWVGSGVGGDPDLGPTWAQLESSWNHLGASMGSNLSQLGTNLGPCWVQIGSSRPSCSNYEGILRPLWAYTIQDAKNDPKIVECFSKKCQKLMLSKFPKSKNTLENGGPEANREKKTMKLKHINFESILKPFWLHLGVLGKALEAILGVWGPT